MCGITGFLGLPERLDQAQAEGTALAMARAIARRGPDSDGAWADPATGIAFGHRRLAILDLSPAGHQPMAAPSGAT
jgi:asparagine synthase (glutamine-hydrolysing)